LDVSGYSGIIVDTSHGLSIEHNNGHDDDEKHKHDNLDPHTHLVKSCICTITS